MTQRVLFVCKANVCRSPLMMWTMRSAIDAADVQVSSAGIRARDALACATARQVADYTGDASRTAIQLTTDLIGESDLILTATKQERAAVARLDMDARSRCFTVLEAIRLGQSVVRDVPAVTEGLRGYAVRLHGRRGLVPAARRSWFAPRGSDPLDLVDMHNLGGRRHRHGLRAVADATNTLARQLLL